MCTFIINRSTGVHNFQSKQNERKWTSTTKGTAFCINYIKKRSYIFTICRNLILIYRCFLIDAILQKLPPIGGHIVDQHVKIPYLKKLTWVRLWFSIDVIWLELSAKIYLFVVVISVIFHHYDLSPEPSLKANFNQIWHPSVKRL